MAHEVYFIIPYKWVTQGHISLSLDFQKEQLQSLQLVNNALASHPCYIISHPVCVRGHRSER